GLAGANGGVKGAAVPLLAWSMGSGVKIALGALLTLVVGGVLMWKLPKDPTAPPMTMAAAEPAASTEAAKDSPSIRVRSTFAGGGAAEIVAIASSSDPKTWWSPDGTALGESFAGADFSALRDPYGERRTSYQFAIRIGGVPAGIEKVYLCVSGH